MTMTLTVIDSNIILLIAHEAAKKYQEDGLETTVPVCGIRYEIRSKNVNFCRIVSVDLCVFYVLLFFFPF